MSHDALDNAICSGVSNNRDELLDDAVLDAMTLEDIIDGQALQQLMDDFYNLTRIGSAVVDIQGKVLVATGWQDICTRFHRKHPRASAHCIESDTILSRGSDPGTFKLYRCKNNMWDMATPIMVGGRHMGNIFLGQFFFEDETPDEELFRAQAREYGFDEQAYMTALERVPRFSRDTVFKAMTYYTRLAHLVSRLSFGHARLTKAMAEQQQAEEEIRQINARLKESLADKDKFFSIIAHDIRSPFIGFLSFIKLLTSNASDLPPEDLARLAAEMQGNAENLNNLLENLLEWAKMQRGFTTFEPRPHALEFLLRESMELVRPTAEQKGIAMHCEMENNLVIQADRPMFTAVIRNLLFNAVKFTKRDGSIRLVVKRENDMVRVMIQDTGVGMDRKTLDRLFALDKRVSLRGTEGERGTGLGLILCKEFIEKHGGNIRADSACGQGSTFTILLPVAAPDAVDQPRGHI